MALGGGASGGEAPMNGINVSHNRDPRRCSLREDTARSPCLGAKTRVSPGTELAGPSVLDSQLVELGEISVCCF